MKTNRALLLFCISAVIVVAPLAAAGSAGRPSSAHDWQNNLWMIGYARQSLLSGHWFPDVYTVASHVGVPQPIFYGPRLYPLLALLSLPLGPQWAVRAACLIVWVAAVLAGIPVVAPRRRRSDPRFSGSRADELGGLSADQPVQPRRLGGIFRDRTVPVRAVRRRLGAAVTAPRPVRIAGGAAGGAGAGSARTDRA